MVSNSFGALKADAVTHVSELIVSGVLPPQNAFEIGVNHNCAESRSSATRYSAYRRERKATVVSFWAIGWPENFPENVSID